MVSKTQNLIDLMNANKPLPRFIVLIGNVEDIVDLISTYTKCETIRIGHTQADLDLLVSTIHRVPGLYWIQNYHKIVSQGSLLKICEEMPTDSYIVITVDSESVLFPAIRSRAQIYGSEETIGGDSTAFARKIYDNIAYINYDNLYKIAKIYSGELLDLLNDFRHLDTDSKTAQLILIAEKYYQMLKQTPALNDRMVFIEWLSEMKENI